MSRFFFSGSTSVKLDEKNRFVLPQSMRFGLVEDGELKFTIALGLGGCLAIYRKSDIEKIVQRFQEKQHVAKFQKFFTLFFSTLHEATCDKLGRVVIPSALKSAIGLGSEMVVAGVLNKIELWPKETYDADLLSYMEGDQGKLSSLINEAFALLDDQPSDPVETLESLV